MKHKQTPDKPFKSTPFSELVKTDADLACLRQKYASKSRSERRNAADYCYHSEAAMFLFNNALAGRGQSGFGEKSWPDGYTALAIDPTFAPALLTVGSVEYQLGRPDEAMVHFLDLTKLPEETEDLSQILDKAGDFLLDNNDYQRAHDLYAAASRAFPKAPLYLSALGFCLSKLGRLEQALQVHLEAVALEPENPKWLNDLGWSYFELKLYDEACRHLEKAVALSPPDYDRPAINLAYVRKKMPSPEKTVIKPKQPAKRQKPQKQKKSDQNNGNLTFRFD